jgi:hypothetical protein
VPYPAFTPRWTFRLRSTHIWIEDRRLRALAHIEAGRCELISRNGNTFRGFADLATWIAERFPLESAVLDGEIARIDDAGRPVFRDLLFRRRQCVFIAFDLIDLNGKNLRTLLLIERKAMFTLIASRFLYILNNLRCIFDSAICGSSNVRRSQRHGALEWILKVFFIVPWRCMVCNNRFLRFRWIFQLQTTCSIRMECVLDAFLLNGEMDGMEVLSAW